MEDDEEDKILDLFTGAKPKLPQQPQAKRRPEDDPNSEVKEDLEKKLSDLQLEEEEAAAAAAAAAAGKGDDARLRRTKSDQTAIRSKGLFQKVCTWLSALINCFFF